MIDATAVGEIITQYEKHGWTPRRALLSEAGSGVYRAAIGEIEVSDSQIDAIWFSRRSKPDSEAWELRRLSGLPFALVAVIPSSADDAEVAATLTRLEDEMRKRTIA